MIKINWQEPKTELDHVYLTLLLWHDISRNDYSRKTLSKYHKYVVRMEENCPLCEYYKNCGNCFLLVGEVSCYEDNSMFQLWSQKVDMRGARKIYKRCLKKVKRLRKDEKVDNQG